MQNAPVDKSQALACYEKVHLKMSSAKSRLMQENIYANYYNHATTKLAIFANEMSQDKLSWHKIGILV